MGLNYTPIAVIDETGLLDPPFPNGAASVGLYDRVWLNRGRYLNRYTGEIEYLTEPTGFGQGEFGNGIFGWS